VSLADTPRGPVKCDHLGNVVGDVFIRKCERKNGQLVNAVIKRYLDVGQFWTYEGVPGRAHRILRLRLVTVFSFE
jgi:branched-chain amino acid transport system substrate-binding protein